MRQLTIELPNSLTLSDFDVRMVLAANLYDAGQLSSGQAAQIVGLSKRAFIERLGEYGVSVFGYDFEDIAADLKNA